MSAASDALREGLQALDIDSVEAEMDELRGALDRSAAEDAEPEARPRPAGAASGRQHAPAIASRCAISARGTSDWDPRCPH
jgi:hypothetical protein